MRMNKKKEIVPKLRFPEFSKSYWGITRLNVLADKITERNKDDSIKRVFTNSATEGVVDQEEYFDRDIANKNNLINYFVVEKGDYVYNPRISTTAPVGPISKNKLGIGVMSPLYTVFRFRNKENDFYEHFFLTNLWHAYIKNLSNTGARHDRITISVDNFMKMPLPYASPEEEQKIADCLSSIDELIDAESRKLKALEKYKKGLMQKLFPAEGKNLPEWRFPEFQGCGEWNIDKLGNLCKITTGKLDANAMVANGKYRFYTCAKEFFQIDKYAFNTEALLISGNGANVGYIHYYKGKFNAYQRTYVLDQFYEDIHYIQYYLERNLSRRINTEKNEGNTPYIVLKTLTDMDIFFPKDLKEQQKIAECLSVADTMIEEQSNKVEQLKAHKKGLMQGLFPSLEEADI